MTEVQNTRATPYSNRRAPVPHSEAVQEAKRREKMETVSSSHRISGANPRPAPADKSATP